MSTQFHHPINVPRAFAHSRFFEQTPTTLPAEPMTEAGDLTDMTVEISPVQALVGGMAGALSAAVLMWSLH